MTDIARHRDLPISDVIELQRGSCEHAGSRLYAELLAVLRDDFDAGGTAAALLAPHEDNAMANAVPLRLLGALHRIILDGREPTLGAWFPSVGGTRTDAAGPAFLEALERHADELRDGLHEGVQTNEVGRAASLVGGFHEVSRRTGLPLRCLEVGSSAGLLQRWDHFFYDNGGSTWGDGDSAIRFENSWIGAGPTWHQDLVVGERKGCDIAPIDITTPAGVAKVRSFLWPDQIDRRSRLDAAIEIAQRVPAPIDAADAGDWVAEQLRDATPGMATVVYHSIVLQYLPRRSFEKLRSAIRTAAHRAQPSAPVSWLRMEPAGVVAEVQLQHWPGGDDEVLATTGYHGPPVTYPPV